MKSRKTLAQVTHQAALNRIFEVQLAAQRYGVRHAKRMHGPVDLFMSAFYDVCTRISHNRNQVAVPPTPVFRTESVAAQANDEIHRLNK